MTYPCFDARSKVSVSEPTVSSHRKSQGLWSCLKLMPLLEQDVLNRGGAVIYRKTLSQWNKETDTYHCCNLQTAVNAVTDVR